MDRHINTLYNSEPCNHLQEVIGVLSNAAMWDFYIFNTATMDVSYEEFSFPAPPVDGYDNLLVKVKALLSLFVGILKAKVEGVDVDERDSKKARLHG